MSFRYDVFLSHSSKDKPIVRPLAERLRQDGVRVWLDEWEIKPGDSIPAKIEEGLEHSRVLVLCMSASAFGSDWAQLESGTFRFRDPLNQERRFIPLRLDDALIKGSLAQFLYINWRSAEREQEYEKLFEACRPQVKRLVIGTKPHSEHIADRVIQLERGNAYINQYAFSSDGKHVLTGSGATDKALQFWDLETERCSRTFPQRGHLGCVALSPDQQIALSGGMGPELNLWDVETGECLRKFQTLPSFVESMALSADQTMLLCGCSGPKGKMRVWNVKTGQCVRVFEGHTQGVLSVGWSINQERAVSGSADDTVRLWDVKSGRCLRVLEGHTDNVWSVIWSGDSRRVLSGSDDKTVRIWDVEAGRCRPPTALGRPIGR